jgi:hypothetical protein
MTSNGAPIEIQRAIAADPAGVALLLAGPSAAAWWDGAVVALSPPRRTGTGYAVALDVLDEGARRHGAIVVAATLGGSEVRLTLAAGTPDRAVAAATRFLDRLARDAQERSSAA